MDKKNYKACQYPDSHQLMPLTPSAYSGISDKRGWGLVVILTIIVLKWEGGIELFISYNVQAFLYLILSFHLFWDCDTEFSFNSYMCRYTTLKTWGFAV